MKGVALVLLLVLGCLRWSDAQSPKALKNLGLGHRMTSVYDFEDGSGFMADLELIQRTEVYGPDITPLRMVVRYDSDDQVHVHITDSTQRRWEVPRELIPRPDDKSTPLALPNGGKKEGNQTPRQLELSYTAEPFGFAITRAATGEVLFNSTPSDNSFNSMVFKDQYLEISTQLPRNNSMFGIGESTRPDGLRLTRNRTYTLWATDMAAYTVDVDLYGAYPFHMDIREGGATHGVLLLNSNGMDIYVGEDFLTYHVIGGVLDFYFFAGPTPLAVIDQYTSLVGRPAPMPYWSFGFHQCRWGYETVDDLKSVVANYKQAQIPLDTIWSDIDYMDAYKDFTFDPVRYNEKDVRAFVEELHANGQQYVPILDPGISVRSRNYPTLERGLEADVFLKNEFGNNYLAQVWPGPVFFPDFWHPNATSWWTREVTEFYNKVPFDGLWIDMNEASNFCTGIACSYDPNNLKEDESANDACMLHCINGTSRFDDPPYKIDHVGKYNNLGDKTIAMTVKHYNGVLEYDAHNLYGLSETIVTEKALKKVTKQRPFILSRSTFVGSGAHTAHWTGDNKATWEDMKYSVVSIMNSGMFGVPMVGADICGFAGNTTEELCSRWMQLGAFYPFARNHASQKSIAHEPYIWESVAASSRKALGMRYQLLPHLYTLMFEATKSGAPIARALFFSFPEDLNTLAINHQFLLGMNILVSPVVTPGATTVDAYFPKGTWYNLFDFTRLVSTGEKHTLHAPWDTINVHVHEGQILPMQEQELTSAKVKKTPFSLVVAFGELESATGKLFIDNGVDMEMDIRDGSSTFVQFFAERDVKQQSGSLVGRVISGEYALQEGLVVRNVNFLGVSKRPSRVFVNGEQMPIDQPKVIFIRGKVVIQQIKWNAHLQSMEIAGLDLPVGKDFKIKWEMDDEVGWASQ
jgi:alpha-glucosidase/alpha-D-xyloside xylohydrolase